MNVPGIGRLRIRSLTAAELRQISIWAAKDENHSRVDEMLLAECLVDDDGNRLYRSSEVNTGTFENWDAAVVRAIADVIDRFTGYRQEAFSIARIETKKNSLRNGHSNGTC